MVHARRKRAELALGFARRERMTNKEKERKTCGWMHGFFLPFFYLLSWEETCAFEDWGIWVGGAAKHAMMSVVYLWFCQCFAFLGLWG